jgi:hypothetical protein
MPNLDSSSVSPQFNDEYFRTLEGTRTEALVKQNMELAWSLHSPEYQLITPAGKTFNREGYLNAIAAGTLRYLRWELGPMEVRASSSMAIVRYRAQLEFPSGTAVTCWHTDSYELRGRLWQAVWSQATAIPVPSQVLNGAKGAV